MRFLLVDRILEMDHGKQAWGIKNVTMSEDFLAHHFPHSPIMPGALIAESLVQLASWILLESSGFRKTGLPVAFEKLKFHRMVRPGDQLHLQAELTSTEAHLCHFKARAYCADKLVAAARFTLECIDNELLQSQEETQRLFDLIGPDRNRAPAR